MTVLLIDNYDSFTYNLFQFMSELGAEVVVKRNDEVTVEECRRLAPTHIVISPGPGNPDESGISRDVISRVRTDLRVLRRAPGCPEFPPPTYGRPDAGRSAAVSNRALRSLPTGGTILASPPLRL